MNEYYCGKDKMSVYSAATFKHLRCLNCGNELVMNPREEEKRHAEEFHKQFDIINQRRKKCKLGY